MNVGEMMYSLRNLMHRKLRSFLTVVSILIGIAAIVASLMFVGLQMRQEQNIASSQVWSERNMLRAEMANLIYANPQIWING